MVSAEDGAAEKTWTWGKARAKVRRIDRTVPGLNSYNWTHWQKMPWGASAWRAARK
jgi:hypothetical protein